ncbi:hypothetical protein LINPERPRIM_LOCUS21015 [Linum perenne]
MHFVVH